jgi:tetratricopeptide (TPR) repeat protein
MAANLMSRRRTVQWAVVCAAALALASIAVLVRQGRQPRLPPVAHYPGLPEAFARALQGARERAVSSGLGANDVRELAHLYQANRLFPEARACFKQIAAGPGGLSASDHYCLAAIAEDASDLDGAQAELRATLKAEAGYVPARLALAEVLFKGGHAEEAGTEYAAILGADADQPQAALGMARVEILRGNDDGAVARLRALVAHHPDSSRAAALLAQVLDRKGDADGAAAMVQLAKQAHEPVAPDPWMTFMLADCYDLQRLGIAFEEYRLAGQMDEALPLLGRLEELDPNGWMPAMLRGWSQKEARHFPEAVDAYRAALARGGDPERISPLLVAVLLLEGKKEDAAALLAEQHSRLPHSVPILLSYCEVAVRMKDDALARRLLAEVLQADPYLYMPNMSLVQILWTSGERDAAAKCLERVARVYPADIDSRGLLGQYYMEKSDPWSAIKPLEQALAVVPAADTRRERLTRMLDTAYLTAGSMEASRGELQKAAGFAEKSIALVPGAIRGYALKANICRHTGDVRGAEEALAKMAALDPGEPSILMSLGDVTFQAGDRDGARGHWQRALELAPAGAAELRTALGLRLSGRVPADALR